MNDLVIILPILLPIAGGILGLLLAKRSKIQSFIGIATSALGVLVAGLLLHTVSVHNIISLELGNWEAPFGISFIADKLAALMVGVSALVALGISIYSIDDLKASARSQWFYPLTLFLIAGVNGAFLTADLFNLYVWFEVMLIASFALMTVGGSKPQFEGGFKYVAINLVASALFLAGLGLLYGKLGTLNMADAALKLSQLEDASLVNSSAVLFLVAFSIKAGLFPFFFWLPASYHTPPIAISALFAGLLTKVGVYALLRCFTLVFTQDTSFLLGSIFVLSLATMVTGVLGAASRFDLKQILSFHIISQIGYMTLGLAIFSQLAIAAAIFYTIHHIIVKTNLFLISGIIARRTGSHSLKHIGGLYKTAPYLALLFFIPAFSLGGIPPLSGFWAKFALIKATLNEAHYWAAAIALLVGIMTLYSMTKIWGEAFWKASPNTTDTKKSEFGYSGLASYMPTIAFALITLGIGFHSQPLFSFAQEAAYQLLNPEHYINQLLSTDYVVAVTQAAP
ncbi:Na+/H+ antiporter subunit D [Pelagicoccus mobilis]|uniref:Na+/H+ antiporter subunit D n=1 Tax=Pelagicoccus mobilis TaxID=415221 RepID=A0A934VMU1_9BACT|nr:Na+/H+ antiporter subunit D [Pelagicoccus mobilis]MBK1879201.1 Na+/H+ antiporter subunit D [Pelagicoccus mobilis]